MENLTLLSKIGCKFCMFVSELEILVRGHILIDIAKYD